MNSELQEFECQHSEKVFKLVQEPLVRVLLLNDGSTTINLQSIVGSKNLNVSVLYQQETSDSFLSRKTKITSENVSLSYNYVRLNLKHTNDNLLNDLKNTDIPLGVLLKKHYSETTRDIFLVGSHSYSKVFDIFPEIEYRPYYYFKSYILKNDNLKLGTITEYFMF